MIGKYLTTSTVMILCWFEPSFAISIENLDGQAGFRMASLRWSYPNYTKGPVHFRVRYCELHPWGLHRCRYQTVDEMTARRGRQEASQGSGKEQDNFVVDIGGLRMSTNYSFQVVPQDTFQKFGARPSKEISLKTKGFSAKATKCLADSSEVIVETGPFYGGRISVEDNFTPGCYIKGDQQSPQTKYTLRIRHKECGSVVDGSKITNVIVVQENIPILTHSTRRFVVVCSFSPDSFTVKAGVTLPRETSVAKSIDFNRLMKISHQTADNINGTGGDAEHGNEMNAIPTTNLQDGSPLYAVSHLYAADKTPIAQSRALEEKLYRGTWETFLVFGMICAAVVCSIISVLWFIKSYRYINNEHEETIRRITVDDDSSDGNSSYDASSISNGSSIQEDETREEAEIELDFEFSEDVNRSTEIANPNSPSQVTLNICSQNFSYA